MSTAGTRVLALAWPIFTICPQRAIRREGGGTRRPGERGRHECSPYFRPKILQLQGCSSLPGLILPHFRPLCTMDILPLHFLLFSFQSCATCPHGIGLPFSLWRRCLPSGFHRSFFLSSGICPSVVLTFGFSLTPSDCH